MDIPSREELMLWAVAGMVLVELRRITTQQQEGFTTMTTQYDSLKQLVDALQAAQATNAQQQGKMAGDLANVAADIQRIKDSLPVQGTGMTADEVTALANQLGAAKTQAETLASTATEQATAAQELADSNPDPVVPTEPAPPGSPDNAGDSTPAGDGGTTGSGDSTPAGDGSAAPAGDGH